jgi:hypothetical protein
MCFKFIGLVTRPLFPSVGYAARPPEFQLSPLPCHIDSNTNAGKWKEDNVEVFNTNYRHLKP